MTRAAARLERPLGALIGVLLVAGALASGLLPPAVLVLSLPFLAVAARRPVLRRLAVRNASRRPRETALILLGALLGTAIITGSATVGDTLGASIRQGAFNKLGPVDLLVRAPDPASAASIASALAEDGDERIDGVLPITTVAASVATPAGGEERRAEPNATLLELDFAAARTFGGDPDATGIDGATPAAGTAAIGADLADELEVGEGDVVEAFAYGAVRRLTVGQVLPRLGVAGFDLGFGSASPNLFVPPGTIAELAAQQAGGAPPDAFVAVSVTGGVIEGAAASGEVATEVIEPAVAAAGVSAQTDPVKADLLEVADEQGASFTQLFTALGTFSALAGILLLISIFIMLAEERKTELGMLRAVGLRRSGLVGAFSLEGWSYALGAAALGTVAGVGVGRVIVAATAGIFGAGAGLELDFTATRASVQRGFTIGFVVSLLTVLATSVWVSRLNVIRAIRDLPEPTVVRQRRRATAAGALVVVLGVAVTASGASASAPAPLLVGPPLAALGAALVLRRRLGAKLADSVAAAAGLFWATACFDLVPEVFDTPDISLFVLDGVVLSVSGVVLVSRHQRAIGAVIRRLGGGSGNLSLRLGLAYPLAKSFRTSLILATFTLVMFTLVSITLFSGVFGQQIDDFTADIAGGFDGQAFSNPSNPVPPAEIAASDGVDLVAPLTFAGVQWDVPSRRADPAEPAFEGWPAAGIDATFVDGGPPSLQEHLDRFPDEEAAWRALVTDPSLVVVDEFFLQRGGGPPEASVALGEELTVRDPVTGTSRQVVVAGLADAGFGQAPAYLGVEGVRSLVGDRAVQNLVRFRVADGVDAEAVAERLTGRYVENGMSASSYRELVGEGLAQQQQFFRLMQGYLSLGLIVSVAGIGVVMVRAVRERRREVGVLRSLGFPPRSVRRAFVAESSFVALEGIALGTGLALVSTWRLLTSGAFGDGLEFAVPYVQVLVLVTLAFVATLAATASPAQQAARIQPAVALRIAD